MNIVNNMITLQLSQPYIVVSYVFLLNMKSIIFFMNMKAIVFLSAGTLDQISWHVYHASRHVSYPWITVAEWSRNKNNQLA